jgi:hypothetical protein
MNSTLKAPGAKCLKLRHDDSLSSFGFKFNLRRYSEDVVKRVKHLITSDDSAAPPGKKFLWDIVANKRNSVDVDKFEYLMRDAHNAGVKGRASQPVVALIILTFFFCPRSSSPKALHMVVLTNLLHHLRRIIIVGQGRNSSF